MIYTPRLKRWRTPTRDHDQHGDDMNVNEYDVLCYLSLFLHHCCFYCFCSWSFYYLTCCLPSQPHSYSWLCLLMVTTIHWPSFFQRALLYMVWVYIYVHGQRWYMRGNDDDDDDDDQTSSALPYLPSEAAPPLLIDDFLPSLSLIPAGCVLIGSIPAAMFWLPPRDSRLRLSDRVSMVDIVDVDSIDLQECLTYLLYKMWLEQ